MSHIPKVTPTWYNGILFRSYLEACWARTLDHYGIHYDYEKHKILLPGKRIYQPDFYLPESTSWLEAKGPHMNRINKVEEFAACLWSTSPASSTYDMGAPLVILGREPSVLTGKWDDGKTKWWADDPNIHAVWMNMTGIMGPGKAHSMVFSDCDRCGRVSPLAPWQPWCRSCHQNYGRHKERYEFIRL